MAYASSSELARMGGLPVDVLGSFSATQIASALDLASGIADDSLRSEYEIPFTAAPIGLKFQVCRIAAFLLMEQRGFDPERGSDALIVKAYDGAIAWLGKVASGAVVLATDGDATPSIDEEAPTVLSRPTRGW